MRRLTTGMAHRRADNTMPDDVEAIDDMPFAEAIRFFQRKARVPTKRWNDVWRTEHSHNFMVAGATSDALLKDFQDTLLKALKEGTTLGEFRKEFDRIVEKHGWAYNGTPGWRSRIIYETNLSTAYSAGLYEQLTDPETLEAFPYWQYVHSGSRHPRLQHLAWDGLVLRADDPFWQTHFPPNGWRCGCRVRPVGHSDLKRMGKSGPDKAPPIEYRPWTDKVTGVVHQVPIGIDPGWDYSPGLAAKTGLANVPVHTDPMKPGTLPSTPTKPQADAPLPKLPEALERFLEAPEDAPGRSAPIGELSHAVERALSIPAPAVRLTADDLAGIRTDKEAASQVEFGVLGELVRRPTVVLVHDGRATLLLRRSGRVWLAELALAEAPKLLQPGRLHSLVTAFRAIGALEVRKLLDAQDQVYGDADDLGGDE